MAKYHHSNQVVTTEDVIPPNYDKYEAPVVDGGAVNVYLMLDVMDVDSIDEGNMEFQLQMYLKEIWRDPRLNLNIYEERSKKTGSNYPLPKEILEKIWKPDVVFDNAKSGTLFKVTIPNTVVLVRPAADFMRNSRYNLKVTCHMNLHLYPMDTQHCFMKIVLFSHSDEKAQLNWISDATSPYRSNYPESIIFKQNIQPLKHVILPPALFKAREEWATGNYTYLYANFTFVRRLSASIVIVYIPSTLVVCLSWTSFWLDVRAAPARITLGVTSFLTLATQAVQAHSYLPPLNYMTALDVWLFVCIITVFFSIIEFATSYHIFQCKKNKTSVAEPIASRVSWHSLGDQQNNNKGVRAILSGTTSKELKLGKNPSVSSHDSDSTSEPTNYSVIDSFCRKLFPILFFLFVLLYWIIFTAIS